MEIEKMLVVSTSHLTETACNEYLPESVNTHDIATFAKGEYGWFVYVPDDVPDNIPASLEDCFEYAQSLGCCWVMFDRDAPTTDALTYYDW